MGLALVCGSRGVLGATVVEAFRARGDEVIGLDRTRVDLADPAAVETLWDDLARNGEIPQWVVNTVGGFRTGTVAEMESWAVRETFALNLEPAWWTARAGARHLQPGSAIVNVAARAAVAGGAGSAAYAVSKAAVVRLTEVLALELAPRQIRANVVLPALIDTPQNRAALPAETMANAVAPQEIADVILFLCSEASSVASGAAVPVYGRA